MININIDPEIRRASPRISLGYVKGDIEVYETDSELWDKINSKTKELEANLKIPQISQNENIKAIRELYKNLGHDPTRYRNSAEALLRRILKGQGLYKVNNIVDINNYISISSFYPVCTYDLDKLVEPITMTIGKVNDKYIGIGRGTINIENLPVFTDSIGAFGSTTSDSERTMITDNTKRFLMIIPFLNEEKDVTKYLKDAEKLIYNYCRGKEIEIGIVK